MSRYGVVGVTTHELLTYGGRAIVHDNAEELGFLLPGARIVRLTDGDLGQPWMWLRAHPDLAMVRWPLRREEFLDHV